MDYTPIQNLLPSQPKNNYQSDQDIIDNYSSDKKSNKKPDIESLDSIIDDIDNDNNDLSIIDRLKGYIKLILIIAILYFIVSNQFSLTLLQNYGGNTLIVNNGSLTLTSIGLLVAGTIMGLLFILIKFALSYIADI